MLCWLFTFLFNMNHASSKKNSLSFRRRNPLTPDSWQPHAIPRLFLSVGVVWLSFHMGRVLKVLLPYWLKIMTTHFEKQTSTNILWGLFPFEHQCHPILFSWSMFSYFRFVQHGTYFHSSVGLYHSFTWYYWHNTFYKIFSVTENDRSFSTE
jgi:hypothetical protein